MQTRNTTKKTNDPKKCQTEKKKKKKFHVHLEEIREARRCFIDGNMGEKNEL